MDLCIYRNTQNTISMKPCTSSQPKFHVIISDSDYFQNHSSNLLSFFPSAIHHKRQTCFLSNQNHLEKNLFITVIGKFERFNWSNLNKIISWPVKTSFIYFLLLSIKRLSSMKKILFRVDLKFIPYIRIAKLQGAWKITVFWLHPEAFAAYSRSNDAYRTSK